MFIKMPGDYGILFIISWIFYDNWDIFNLAYQRAGKIMYTLKYFQGIFKKILNIQQHTQESMKEYRIMLCFLIICSFAKWRFRLYQPNNMAFWKTGIKRVKKQSFGKILVS